MSGEVHFWYVTKPEISTRWKDILEQTVQHFSVSVKIYLIRIQNMENICVNKYPNG